MAEVHIYTDGACSGNPGPGGWGAVLIYKGVEKEISGFEKDTTNNRMELTAVIKALEGLKFPCEVTIYTDSAYVCKAFTEGWINNWMAKGWVTSKRTPVENKELWQSLIKLVDMHQVKWVKVKGHSDNEKNNRCDLLARQAIAAGRQ
ncbi:Ribonuclease H [bioreactor metagenome]|uniref:ribonuclease H n=1 Tax=bioreactor metagenome TaxID=1076179 RepID=A0A644SXT1_9ZZZZ|nr:ribonuclease HI [Negativicutes bacterium]